MRSLRPLIRRGAGSYVTACGRFLILNAAADRSWEINYDLLCPPQSTQLRAWMSNTHLNTTKFPRLADALAALEAHLAVHPLDTPPSIAWNRVDRDTWEGPDGWKITTKPDVAWFRWVNAADNAVFLTRHGRPVGDHGKLRGVHCSVRSAKQHVARLTSPSDVIVQALTVADTLPTS